MQFEFRTVPNIFVGTGSSKRLANTLLDTCGNIGKVFFITDKILLELGVANQALESLKEKGIQANIYCDVVPDPPEAVVLEAYERAKAFGADAIIGLGGGSSLDTAKLVATLLGSDQPLKSMYGVNQVTGRRLPLVLVPTTAGTGSEVTPVSIVTVDATTKMGVSSPVLYGDIALLDAGLTTGLPKAITAATGIDAMVHAIEAYTSRIHKNPISDNLARVALQKLHGNIERACTDGHDLAAREEMLLGAMYAGQAFANAPVGAVHALAYPLGATFHVPHGLSNSLILSPVLEFNATAAEDLYAELASCIGLPATSRALIDEMTRIANATGIETRLHQVGVKEEDLAQLAEDAMKISRLLVNNPREMTFDDALACYKAVL